MKLPHLELKPSEEKRILRGEFWVFENEVASDIRKYQAGELVELVSSGGDFVARGYVNPFSKIVFRVLTYDRSAVIDREFFRARISRADALRKGFRPGNQYYRMVFAEADFLPGLVIDRFADLFVVQITTAGTERFREVFVSILEELYPGCAILERSLNESRTLDGLPPVNTLVRGDSGPRRIEINGVIFAIDFLNSQKTGFFLDQRDNYLLLKNISAGRRVLDAFCYLGSWGLHAARFGAAAVDFLEISRQFLDQTRENAVLNGFDPAIFSFIKADAVRHLKKISAEGARYDLIILDPPAFVKNRQTLKSGIQGYREINLRALKMIPDGGHLVTCSCSHFLSAEQFLDVISQAARDAGRRVRLLQLNLQPYDHPVLLPLMQSRYLKCALFDVS